VTVVVREFQPFASRVGVDTVLSLRSAYDPELVETVKRGLRDAQHLAGVKNPGGWLRDGRVWFVEHDAWPYVRDLLEAGGHTIRRDGGWDSY
jgi:hypothetical protein